MGRVIQADVSHGERRQRFFRLAAEELRSRGRCALRKYLSGVILIRCFSHSCEAKMVYQFDTFCDYSLATGLSESTKSYQSLFRSAMPTLTTCGSTLLVLESDVTDPGEHFGPTGRGFSVSV